MAIDKFNDIINYVFSKSPLNHEARERNQLFNEKWEEIDPEDKNEYLQILKFRASMILPDRDNSDIIELLPWNLLPNEDEMKNMLTTWFPKHLTPKSFVKECIRWKVSTTTSIVEEEVLRGARTGQILVFVKMMKERHSKQFSNNDININIDKELEDMIKTGHFNKLKNGFITPNLFQVKVDYNQAILFSGWPFRLLYLKEEVIDDEGIYKIQLREDIPTIEINDYISSNDPIKSMVNSSAQYIESFIEMAEGNSVASTVPDRSRLLGRDFETSPAAGKIRDSHFIPQMTWKLGDYEFLVEKEGYDSEGNYLYPKIWICPNNLLEEIRKNNWNDIFGWRFKTLRWGALKKIYIAYLDVLKKPISMKQCPKKLFTSEMIRFSMLNDMSLIGKKEKDKFLKENWLRKD